MKDTKNKKQPYNEHYHLQIHSHEHTNYQNNECQGNHNHILIHDHKEGHYHFDENLNISGKKLLFVIILNFIITISEIIGGLISSSLALLSDSLHNFADTTSVVLSWFAIKISKKAKDKKRTYGYKRAQIIAAFINSQFLMVIAIFLVTEAIKKFFNPVEIKTIIMLPIAIIGFLANFVSILILHKDANHSLNIKSSYLHILSDTLSSVGVIIGGILIAIFKINFVDGIITLIIAIYIGIGSFKIIIKTINILMQSSAELDYDMIKVDIESIPNVKSLHHVHTWLTDEKTIYFEAHAELCDIPLSETTEILEKINKILFDKYKISHTTIQFEVERGCNKNIFNIDSK